MKRPPALGVRYFNLKYLAGASRREAAERFKVSAASAVRWAQLDSQTGGVGPRPRGGKSRSPLEPHAAWLLDLTTAEPDLTLEAIVQRLLAGLGQNMWKAAVRRFLKRHATTLKKTAARRKTGPARHTPGAQTRKGKPGKP